MSENYRYNSVAMAKFIIVKARDAGIQVNMTKIQKFLYIAYGAMLGVYGERLVDEHPQAWPYGPVFPKTREHLLKYNNWGEIHKTDEDVKDLWNDNQLHKLMEFVFKNFGNWNASRLSEWSHKEGSPWFYTVYMVGFEWGKQIADNLIQMYFKSIIVFNKRQENA